jgi:hypothetical protein
LVVNRIDDEAAAAEVRPYGTQLRSKEEVNPGRRLTHSRRIQGSEDKETGDFVRLGSGRCDVWDMERWMVMS